MKTRLLIIIGMITVFLIALGLFVIPEELWVEYFAYPNVDADIVCKINGGQWDGTGNYCDDIIDICEHVGGTKISWYVTPECKSEITDTGDSVCLDRASYAFHVPFHNFNKIIASAITDTKFIAIT